MELHHYHPATGEYLGSGQARESPRDPGEFLIPANATPEPPPAPQAGHARVHVDGAWVHVPDRRGETWWTAEGVAVVIDFLADPAGQGLTDQQPAPPPEPEPTLPALSPRQLRLMMLQLGIDESAVTDLIAAMPDAGERAAAMVEWQWATFYRRDHALVVSLAAAMEFEPGQLDVIWAYAADL
jgi:hypothetical protein